MIDMRRTYMAIFLVLLLVVAGCGTSNSNNTNNASSDNATNVGDADKKIRVAYYVNGVLGDKGYLDSVQRGMDNVNQIMGVETKTVIGGSNQADWPAGLETLVSSGKYDIIVVGSGQMIDVTKEIAAKYPKQQFIFFDDVIKDVPNVYSMTYSQSEGSFLAGAFAALVSSSTELQGANPDKLIGFVGGMDIPIVNDFKYGYEQGAQYIDPAFKVVASYVGDFNNAPKAKELSLAQYNTQNVDIIYNVAGGSGLGILEAGAGIGKYSIGVDGNQNVLYPGSVLTSMMKNVEKSIARAFDLYRKGTLPFGTSELLGLKESGVELAKDDLYEQYVPQSIRDRMKEIEGDLINGKIVVKSSL